MERMLVGICTAIAFLCIAMVGADGQSNSTTNGAAMTTAPNAGKTESFCGTVANLTESGCIGVKSSNISGERLYEITSANPKPTIGTLIAGSGTTGGMTSCMEGIHLNTVKWQRAAACPVANNKTK